MKWTYITLSIVIFSCSFTHHASAMERSKKLQKPPQITGVHYRFCQPLTEQQKRRQKKMGTHDKKKVAREQGQKKYNHRHGTWSFWNADNKKIAQGPCLAPPPYKKTAHHGQWTYWTSKGLKVEATWVYGKLHGRWTLYNKEGKKVWQFMITPSKKREEIFSDTAFLKSNPFTKLRPVIITA